MPKKGGESMKELNTQKVALVVGVFISGWHVLWSILIILGAAQPLLDFIFWIHMISNPYQITGFNLTQSVILILVAFVVGYVGGWIFAWLWNMMHKK